MYRWTPLFRLASTFLLLLPAGALAYTINPPENMQDIEDVMNEIPAELEAAQCGGWLEGESVGDVPGEGYITKVTGVPGREGKPLEDIPSGMGVRINEGGNGIDVDGNAMNDGYEFPDSVTGLSTRCPAETESLTKVVWSYTRPSWIEEYTADTLYFEDPPCSWREDGSTELHSPETCQEFCSILNEQTYADCYTLVGDSADEDNPDAIITCALWCMKNTCTDGWTDICNTSLRSLIGDDAFFDARDRADPSVVDPNLQDAPTQEIEAVVTEPPIQNENCVPCAGEECRCTEPEVKSWEKAPRCILNVPGDLGAPDMGNLPDDTADVIAGCRNLAIQSAKAGDVVAPNLDECFANAGAPNISLMEGRYVSFFRRYDVNYERKALTDVIPDDQATEPADDPVEAACFGFYREIDHAEYHMEDKPGETVTVEEAPWDNRYRRCVVDMDLSERIQTQRGKGEYGANTEIIEPEELINTDEDDMWVDVLRGFSMMNPERTRDISKALLQLNAARSTAVRLFDDPEKTRPTSATTRAFDDTGRARSVVTWWQGLMNQAAEIAAPSTLHLLLPPSWVLGLDDEKELQREEVTAATDAQERRLQSVDVQIGAESGALDEIVETLESGLLFRLEEYPVAIVAFSASPEELRSLADAHCLRAMQRTGLKKCDDAMTETEKTVRTQLQKYADAAEDTRLLRIELVSYIATLVQAQTNLLEPLQTWLDEHRAKYENFLTQRAEILTLSREWDKAEAAMAEFPNMPFCMNQRFLTPMPSLLDPGLEERKALLSAEPPTTPAPWEMPMLPELSRSLDAVIDASMLRAHPTTIAVPVLQPIVWRLDLGTYAPGNKSYPELPDPPSLQPALDALASARKSLPSVCSPTTSSPDCMAQAAPNLILPLLSTNEDRDRIRTAITAVVEKIEDMSVTYGRFWQAAGPLYPENANAEENEDASFTLIDDATGRAAAGNLSWWLKQGGGGWSDIDSTVADFKPILTCSYWNTLPCGFTENDLKEAIARLNARPMVELDEDRQSIGGVRLHATVCLPGDEVCRILTAEDRPAAKGWQIESPTAQRGIPNIGSRIREVQLPEPLGQAASSSLPPYDPAGGNVVEILAPALFVPDEEALIPASATSSSARSRSSSSAL